MAAPSHIPRPGDGWFSRHAFAWVATFCLAIVMLLLWRMVEPIYIGWVSKGVLDVPPFAGLSGLWIFGHIATTQTILYAPTAFLADWLARRWGQGTLTAIFFAGVLLIPWLGLLAVVNWTTGQGFRDTSLPGPVFMWRYSMPFLIFYTWLAGSGRKVTAVRYALIGVFRR
jgi:hypothetical protein